MRLLLPRARRQVAARRPWTLALGAVTTAGLAVLGIVGLVVGHNPVFLLLLLVSFFPPTTARSQVNGLQRGCDTLARELDQPGG